MESINSVVDRYIKVARDKQYLEQSMKLSDNTMIKRINENKKQDIEKMNKILEYICNEFETRLDSMRLEDIERIKKILMAKIYNLKNKSDSLSYSITEGSGSYSRYFSEEKYRDTERYLSMASIKYAQLDDLYFNISCYDYFLNIIDIYTTSKVNKKVM